MSEPLSELVGSMVLDIEVDEEDRGSLFIDTPDGTYVYKACGECGSTPWIKHFDDIELIRGQVVTSVDSFTMGDDQHKSKDESRGCLTFYKSTIKTAKASSDIECRNGSDGYYGVWLEFDEFIPSKK